MDEKVLVGRAAGLAILHHYGQVDKAGKPYIFHPIRVAAAVKEAGYADEYVAAAFLHDIVEDTGLTLDNLRAIGFPEAVVRAVEALTKIAGEPHADAVARAAADPIAKVVKAEDIRDNYGRIAALDDAATRDRLTRKYEKAAAILGITLP